MDSGRTTRSKRKLAEQEHEEQLLQAKHLRLAMSHETMFLTPPQTQPSQSDEGVRTRRGRSAVRSIPYATPSPNMRTRYGSSVHDSSSSSSSSDPYTSLVPFHSEDISLQDYGPDMWPNMAVMNSENDPLMHPAGADSSDSLSVNNRSRDLHTPPMSPDMLGSSDVSSSMIPRPDTPTIRPATPGDLESPLTPMDGSLVHSSLDSTSLVESNSMISYGPPPTPMGSILLGGHHLPRVGTLSSFPLPKRVDLQISSANSTTSASAVPPANILDSEEENVDNFSDEGGRSDDNLRNTGTDNLTYINNNTTSPDISEPWAVVDPTVSSTPSPPESAMSKHSHRLRIRAPLPSRSCRSPKSKRKTSQPQKRPYNNNISEQASQRQALVPKSILKVNCSESTIPPERPKLKLNFLNAAKLATKLNKRVSYSEDVEGGTSNHFTPPSTLPSSSLTNTTKAKPNQADATTLASSSLPVAEAKAATSPAACRNQPHSLLTNQSNEILEPQDGCMKYIRLKNFMTHSNLAREFKVNAVIVHGRNGSGKSSILIATQVAFADKASNTNRTSSVTGFIKKGCRYFEIELWLTNSQGALPKDEYGEVVVIFRRTYISGGSIFKIGIGNGEPGSEVKLRPVKQGKIIEISHAFQVFPNNPIQFLQQERNGEKAKTGSSRGKDFQMLKDATRITESENMLNSAKDNLKVSNWLILQKNEYRKDLALQEKHLKEKCDLIVKIEESESTIAKLTNELKWSQVQVDEEELRHIKSTKEEKFGEIKELKERRKGLEEKAKTHVSDKDKAQKMVAIIKKEFNEYNNEKEAKSNELREVTKTLRRVENEFQLTQKAVRGYTKKIAELEGQLKEDRVSYEEQNQMYRAEIQKRQDILPEREAQLEKLRNQRDKIFAEMNEYIVKEKEGNTRIRELESELRQTKTELDKRDNFGLGVKEMIERIKTTRWIKTPIGPMGAYINIHKNSEKYGPLIEHILDPALDGFVIQTSEDKKTFNRLIQEVFGDNKGHVKKGRRPTVIFVPPFDINDYLRQLKIVEDKFRSKFKSVMSVLVINEPMVKVGLIYVTNCERIVLFEDNSSAAQVMKGGHVHLPPELKYGFTLEWFRVTAFPNFQFRRLDNIKHKTNIIPTAKHDTVNRIKQMIVEQKQTIQTCAYSLKGFKDGKTNHPGLREHLKQHDSEISKLNKEINDLNHGIKHAESMVKESSSETQDQNIQAQIRAEQDMLAKQEMKLQVKQKEMELADSGIKKIIEDQTHIDNEVAERHQKLKELENTYKSAHAIAQKIEREAEAYTIRIKRLEEEFHHLSLQETKVMEQLNDSLQQATERGERPEFLERHPDKIQTDLEQLQTFQMKHKNIVLAKRKIFADHENAKKELNFISEQISYFEVIIEKFQPHLKVNCDSLVNMKYETSHSLEMNFQTLCEDHGLTGKLMVDWSNEMLFYYVSPDKHSDARARKNFSVVEVVGEGEVVKADKLGLQNYCNNLSGGERSKAQVFFILAMWEVTDLPCHFVDEFETFMDDPSRIKIQKLLLKHANRHPEKQYFFFTPQILVGIRRDDPRIDLMHLVKRDTAKVAER